MKLGGPSTRAIALALGGFLVAGALAASSAATQSGVCHYAFTYWSPIHVVPGTADRLTAAPGCVLTSADGGHTWRAGPTTSVRYVMPIGTHGALLGIDGSELERSTDGGATWTVVFNGVSTPRGEYGVVGRQIQMARTPLVPDAVDPHAAWLCNASGIFRTIDDGLSWMHLPGSPQCWALAVQPRGRTLIADSNSGKVVRSSDAGDHWAAMNLPSFGWVTFSSSQPYVVVGVSHQARALQFWRSGDSGKSWVRTTAVSGRKGYLLPLPGGGAGMMYGGDQFVAGVFYKPSGGDTVKFAYFTSRNGKRWRRSIVVQSNSDTRAPLPWIGVEVGGVLVAPAAGASHGVTNIFALATGATHWTLIGEAPDCPGRCTFPSP
jgi:hypothetical protein